MKEGRQRQDNISTVFSPQDLPHPGISSQVINCRNDRDMLSIALIILLINIVMSLGDWETGSSYGADMIRVQCISTVPY